MLSFHSKMAGFRERERKHFPLQDIRSVVNLFRDQLENNDQPNLSLLSIVLGVIENTLTVNRAVGHGLNEGTHTLEPIFPVVQLSTVEALYQRYVAQIKAFVDLSHHDSPYTSRELVKRVSDVVWGQLTRGHYKDKAHLQSLYSYLTGNKLDCYGVALAVVAACQILGLNDVHLALSEDHAWVIYGKDQCETAEVTWHGKGVEDKRGQSINIGVAEKSWLYLNGHAIHCTRQMEVASIVSSINPAISANLDSIEMASLQQELLWLLYDLGHLQNYPMAIGNLGELEEVSPTPSRPEPLVLFEKAVESANSYYDNHHVYPHTYMGQFFYRHERYKDALRCWANAASVIKKFNHNKEDEEIYKEFLQIANDLIPTLVKQSSETIYGKQGEIPLLQDSECYALLLQFYDGICQWEEGSSTPVLHVGWAKHLVYSLSKFGAIAREAIHLHTESDDEKDDNDNEDKDKENEDSKSNKRRLRRSSDAATIHPKKRKRHRPKAVETATKPSVTRDDVVDSTTKDDDLAGEKKEPVDSQMKTTIEELESKVEADSQDGIANPHIDALAKACGESILNPDYLLSGGEPFTTASCHVTTNNNSLSTFISTSTGTVTSTTGSLPFSQQSYDIVDYKEFLSSKSNNSPFGGMTMDSLLKAESPADMMICKAHCRPDTVCTPTLDTDSLGEVNTMTEDPLQTRQILLASEKMKALKKLLTTEKLNGSAIKLQLTAQSQVQWKSNKSGQLDSGTPSTRKSRKD